MDVRRRHRLAAVDADIAVAKIVGNDEQDVGRLPFRLRRVGRMCGHGRNNIATTMHIGLIGPSRPSVGLCNAMSVQCLCNRPTPPRQKRTHPRTDITTVSTPRRYDDVVAANPWAW